MRRQAFCLTILGIFILILLLNLSPKQITSPEQPKNFQPNQKIITSSIVTKETLSKSQRTLHLSNNISIQCSRPCPSFLNRNITATAILEKYNNKNYLNILEVKPQNQH